RARRRRRATRSGPDARRCEADETATCRPGEQRYPRRREHASLRQARQPGGDGSTHFVPRGPAPEGSTSRQGSGGTDRPAAAVTPLVDAALRSWPFDPWLLAGLLLSAIVYLRGWSIYARRDPLRWHWTHPAAFISGLVSIYVALASPIEPFASLLVS